MHTNRKLVLIGGLILVIGSRLPWISVPVLFGVEGLAYESIEIGWEDNGIITRIIGFILILGAVLIRGRAGRRYSLLDAILAALAIMVVIVCFQRILEINPSAGFFAATDLGLYITLIGALLAMLGALRRIPLSARTARHSRMSHSFHSITLL